KGVQVYPNPTNGRFSVDFYSGNTIKEVKLKILTVTGQLILNEVYNHTGGRFTKELNLENQAKGVYFVEIDADGIKETKRVVLR
ncbi:MAG: C-terminal target protein, partial [Flavipsychrobacter sp.]|nr:C-terminal target protein [Flavipsychrobacter sp.]